MKYNNVKYGILLTREQLDFLKDDNQGFHRMKAFDTFLSLAAIEPFHYEKKNFSADLGIGQFAISKVELAELWHCDRKTAQKIIDLFNEVGILTSIANNRTTIHTIHCLAFWFVDGRDAPIKNPNYHRNTVTTPSSYINPVPSLANANNDEREENKLSPYGEDGQLPVGYLDQLDEHYANLLPGADKPYSTSNDVALGGTPAMPTNPEGISDVEGSTNQLVSPIPSTTAADAADSAEYPLHGSD